MTNTAVQPQYGRRRAEERLAMLNDTGMHVRALVGRSGGFRQACTALGLPESKAPTLSRIARGVRVGRRTENAIRAKLNLAPLGCERWRDAAASHVAALIRNRQPI